jgi:hypothetical protein
MASDTGTALHQAVAFARELPRGNLLKVRKELEEIRVALFEDSS